MTPRHVILVGLPGSGKSTIGALVADRLGAPFRDLDRLVEENSGRAPERVFAELGEAAFRALERDAATEALAGAPAVIAPGGGWFADLRERSRGLEAGLCVYLETSPATCARRLGDAAGRPLLAGPDVVRRLGELLGEREAAYLEAHGRVATDQLEPDAVAARVVELARAEGGW